jgi:hypothetical protein
MRLALVVGSGFFNIALLVAIIARPSLAPPALEQFIVRHLRAEKPAQPSALRPPPRKQTLPPLAAWAALHTDDPALMISRLRAAGFPASVIRSLVSSDVSARYDAEIRRLQDPDPNTPFWKLSTNFFMTGDKRLEELNRLYRERSRVLRDLFKDAFFATTEATIAQRRQFGDLPLAKIEVLQRIEDDYSEMLAAVRMESKGITLPEDREKLALLHREKKADLAAMLTPQEMENYELRASQTANTLRTRLANFEPTEQEFRALYQAQLALNEKFQGGFNAVDHQTRTELQQSHFDRLRSELGEQRFADYIRETSSEFEQLTRLAQRDNIPRETALRAYGLRHAIAAESNQIFDNAALSNDAKRDALKHLATTARTQILATLGPSAGPEFVRIANQWLNMMERGAALTFNRPNMFFVVSDQGTMSMSGSGAQYRHIPMTPAPKK